MSDGKCLAPRNFVDAPGPQDIRGRSVRGAAVTGVGQVAKMALRFAGTAVLARLLTPTDYGLVAMSAVIVGFVAMFKDAGLTSATIQRDKLTHEQVSALFWINSGLGIGLAVMLMVVSPLIATFYKDPRLTGVTCVLALTFVLGGVTVQHQALLRRQMRFTALAKIDVSAMMVGVLVAIGMAASGYGYWSLVGMSVASALATSIGVAVACPWRPSAPRRAAGTSQLLVFGSDLLRFNFVNYFSRQADSLLIGWSWGPAALGLYDKAYSLLLLPIAQVNAPLASVAVPALSRLRTDTTSYARLYLNGQQILVSITVPIIVGIALFAEEVVWLWLGPEWLEAATLFRLLSAAALVGAISNPIGWLLISLGQTRRYRRMGFYTSLVIITSFIIGLQKGAAGVAACYSVAMCLLFFPLWYFALRDSPIKVRAAFESFIPPFASVAVAAIAAYAVRHFAAGVVSSGFSTPLAALAFLTAYSLILLLLFRKLGAFVALIRELRPRSRNEDYSPQET